MNETDCDRLDVENPSGGAPWRIARRLRKAASDGGPGIVWLGGFASDMESTKAGFLDAFAKERGRAFLRFDYSGHGASDGRFEDGCIGDWLEQTVVVFDRSTQGPQIVVGSSMGGWLALLLARRLAEKNETARLAGLVLLAPAVDFTEALMWKNLDEAARREIMEKGAWMRASQYSPDPTPITRRLVEDGRKHLLLGGVIRSYARVHILQGMADPDVPWRHALTIMEHLSADPATLTFIADGDHRLSRAQDLAQLAAAVELMSAPAKSEPPRDLFG
ncbi:alpha/beta hydrolase [Methylocystis parvus]|uniref:Palmitoyl-protein thioesterase ABHD10, mitochondrial n=1 Tax=Methylocystis parvus TaxID=134 RepID=A0A6B8M7Z2_9HYPH|nr:alpha/beta fold hydrolase [Methylocystis parvus]QGM96860.1 alpha/beta fold hydrolase [Methylocystis parvus]WBJ99260.1 alpha/beta fold hydrolase [Methylocystis parvus OBBP]